jgi:hypothetical protein
LAQLESGETLSLSGPRLAALYRQSRQIPLASLEGSFAQFTSSLAAFAYAESLAAAELIRDQYGDYQIPYLLKALAEGRSMTEALQRVLRTRYEELETQIGESLNRRYSR